MMHFVHPNPYTHVDRSYLTQWFQGDRLIVTDVDINRETDLGYLVRNHPCRDIIVDLSHNAMALDQVPDFLGDEITLTTEWTDWYQPRARHIYYFPLWFWMFSIRTNQWYQPTIFDAGSNKTLPMMCLNRNPHPHRVRFGELIAPIKDRMVYTLGNQTLPGEQVEEHTGMVLLDISVKHPVYSDCAVNVVTETVMGRMSLSEKTCKPFVARQIPIIVGPKNCNRFLCDLGLDMFGDLVPWATWDDEEDQDVRMQRIAAFVIAWMASGRVLDDYKTCRERVERNKQYFHSDLFRSVALRHMPRLDPYGC